MVTRYEVISSGWSSNFWVKILVFSTSFNKNVNLVPEIMQSALYVLFFISNKKLPFLAGSQDGDHFCWRNRPPVAPPSIKPPPRVKKIKGFPLKAKSFRNTATYQKLRVGFPSSTPLHHRGGMNLRVRPRVKLKGRIATIRKTKLLQAIFNKSFSFLISSVSCTYVCLKRYVLYCESMNLWMWPQ